MQKRKIFTCIISFLVFISSEMFFGCKKLDEDFYRGLYRYTPWEYDDSWHWREKQLDMDNVEIQKGHHLFGNFKDNNDAVDDFPGTRTRICQICKYEQTVTIGGTLPSHTHLFSESWTSNLFYHWHEAVCEHKNEVSEKAFHIEEDGKCVVCGISITHDSFFESFSFPIDAATGYPATKNSSHVYFGLFPRTILSASDSEVVYEDEKIEIGGNTYYRGSEGNYYCKVLEDAYFSFFGDSVPYSDGTIPKEIQENSYKYFRVEPVMWKVLTPDYRNTGKALLFAEETVTANVGYYQFNNDITKRTVENGQTVYSNNYKYSQVRAYLNGLEYYYDETETQTVLKSDYKNKGFLQTAFTPDAQLLIENTIVNNSFDGFSYNFQDAGFGCEDTEDKIFLLSSDEVENSAYLFGENGLVRKATDYAKANHAYQSSGDSFGGDWWLRTPDSSANYAHDVNVYGSIGEHPVSNREGGIVPALCIQLP